MTANSPIREQPLRRQVPWVVGCRVVGILATVGGNILAARLLGPTEYGNFLFLFSIAACGSLLSAGGLSDAVLRFASENLALDRPQTAVAFVRRAFLTCTVSSLLAAGIVSGGLTLFHLVTGKLDQPALLILLTVVTAVAIAWQQLAAEVLRGWDDLKTASFFSGGFTGGPISASLFLTGMIVLTQAQVRLDTSRTLALLAISVCCTLPFALACAWRVVRHAAGETVAPAVHLRRDQNRQLLAMAGTLLLLNVLCFGSEQLDIWIGGAALRPEQLGVYGVAKRSMMLVAMPVQMAILTVVGAIPRLYAQGRHRELQNLLRGSAGLAALPSLAALLVLVLFPVPAMQFLFGSSYSAAAPIIRIMSVGYLVFIFIGSANNLLILTGGHRTALAVNVVAASFTAVTGPFAAGSFGAVGLAWAATGALTLQGLLLWCMAYRQSGCWTHIGLLRLRSSISLPISAPFTTQSESA